MFARAKFEGIHRRLAADGRHRARMLLAIGRRQIADIHGPTEPPLAAGTAPRSTVASTSV